MRIPQRALRTTAVTAAVATTALGLAAVATAQGSSDPSSGPSSAQRSSTQPASARPAFLAPDEMPQDPDYVWHAKEPAAGLPEHPVFCLEGVLPSESTWHRRYWTDLDTSGIQLNVRSQTVEDARALAEEAEKSVRACAAEYEETYPGAEGEGRDYGRVDVQEGAHVYGVDTAHPEVGSTGVHLFGVGRDSRTVTVVLWGQMGDLPDAPVEDFRETTRTAVEKLYR